MKPIDIEDSIVLTHFGAMIAAHFGLASIVATTIVVFTS